LRTLQIGRALRKIGDVTLAVVSSEGTEESVVRKTAAEFRLEPQVRVDLAPNVGLVPRLRWALNPRFLNVHGCLADGLGRARLLNRLDDFDLVWVSNSRTANILNQWRWPRSVLDIDDLPSTFERTVWQNSCGFKERLKAGARMVLLKRRELLLRERFAALAVCSEADRQYLGGGSHIHVIPNGFERPSSEPRRDPSSPPRIGFIGLFSYPPNLEGVRWFVEECWRKIKTKVPDARLRLVGRDTDGTLKPGGLDIDGLGWVADPAAEIATWSAMVIPLRHGAGTRVKIADAFSRKCPVVSTRLGAFGYEVQHRQELLLADAPAEFAAACISLIKEPASGATMAERAFAAFLKNWTWDAIAPNVWAAAEDGLGKGRSLSEECPLP
jgi:glycosyltransferase involved in cell wall biosynthesis